ncbi:hypothetical protein GE09DRAFT_600282 [Coniochaeta sp. 2T2.1]|nr:hypothetical protein GE09DRAFT_600282 [Coniochaeta sp. 2T2.1]
MDEASVRTSAPRLYHKKSRTGCATCKRRRVKCDEKRPSCTGCSRHGVTCTYPNSRPLAGRHDSGSPAVSSHGLDRPSPSLEPQSHAHAQAPYHPGLSPLSGNAITPINTPQEPSPNSSAPPGQIPLAAVLNPPENPATPFYYPPYHPPPSTSTSSSPPQDNNNPNPYFPSSVPDPPESRHRRLWELRLLHNYIETLHQAKQPTPQQQIGFAWTREIPLLAFQDDAILYAILAQSALNLWTRAPNHSKEREDMRTLQTTYLAMALREQRGAVAGLTRRTADKVCMASLTILHHAYALVQTTIEDEEGRWQPPLEWLRVGRGTGKVWTVARGLLTQPREGEDDSQQAKIHAFLASPPNFDMDEIFDDANKEGYMWLLDDPEPRDEDDSELQDQVTKWVYGNALAYTGWVAKSVESGDAEFAVQRRLAAFAVWMPGLLEEFCQQRRPRALVVLAWFFRLWIPYGHRWEVAGVGERMIRGIYGELDERWRVKLEPIYQEYGWL